MCLASLLRQVNGGKWLYSKEWTPLWGAVKLTHNLSIQAAFSLKGKIHCEEKGADFNNTFTEITYLLKNIWCGCDVPSRSKWLVECVASCICHPEASCSFCRKQTAENKRKMPNGGNCELPTVLWALMTMQRGSSRHHGETEGSRDRLCFQHLKKDSSYSARTKPPWRAWGQSDIAVKPGNYNIIWWQKKTFFH